ncbi:FecR family protein [Saccharicrinis sp. FJH54]|uniref:FecR family protein n=1 Tax=Saccharicrinis sp. FJH54 TaxID=3344665 RepID=UPI0035D512B2
MMIESKHIDEIDRLIVRYKNNDASKDEQLALLNWIKESGSNRKYYQETVALCDRLNNAHVNFDSEKAYENFLKETAVAGNIFKLTPFLRIAASVLIVLSIGLTALFLSTRSVNQVVVATNVEILDQDLPDKTEVTLNKESELTYPSRFTEEKRKVKLNGQAFFNVHHNEKHPFVVKAGPVEVEVLGTSFDVHNDTLLQVTTVTVETGKVKVSYPDNNFIAYLEPGDQCSVNWGNKSTRESKVNDANYKAWLTKVLVFESSPLSKVIKDLNQVYDKKIVIADQNLRNCMLTTKIDNTPQKEVLTMLEKSLNVEVIDNGEMYIIIGDGCVQ